MTNRDWLLTNADVPIRYNLTHDQSLVDGLLSNNEISSWLQRLTDRVAAQDLSNIHGSHNYRYDNIMKIEHMNVGESKRDKEVVSSAASSGGEKRCEFLFEVLDGKE